LCAFVNEQKKSIPSFHKIEVGPRPIKYCRSGPWLGNTALEAICNQSIYSNKFKLLQILVTLPVSSATNERTFSNLKRINTYLRNSMSEVNYFKLKKIFLLFTIN